MPDIALNSDLLRLVEDKRVAIVGPALYLTGMGRGPKFDRFDIVVRPNEIIPLRHLRCDYGSKTDVMFCNFGTTWIPGIKRKIALDDHVKYFKSLKLVVASAIKAHHAETNYLSWPDEHVSSIVKNFSDINEYDLPFYWIGVRDYKTLYHKIGVEFNTGIAAISMLLHYPVKEVFVTGFTFYKGGNTYDELYCEGHMDDIDTKGRGFGWTRGHGELANRRQLDYFKGLLVSHKDRLRVDNEMKSILSL